MQNLKDRVTIYQVAQASGVSLATVSRVINKKGNVTEETRKRVEETIKALNYKPSGLAQALATNRTTNIGVIIPSANYVYIANLLNGIAEVAKNQGYVLTLFTTSHSRDEALSMIDKVITAHVDGVVIFDDELSEEDVMKIASYNVPAVVVNSKVTGDKVASLYFSYGELLDHVMEDYYAQGGEKEMTFLHVHNCGRLLSRCEKIFASWHKENDKTYAITNCDDSYTKTYGEAMQYFQTHRKGYFIAYRDSIAAAMMNAATDSGLKIPEDVEVLSLVGTKYANILRPTMSSLEIDMNEAGKRAMYMLNDLLEDNLFEKNSHIDAKYVKRNSTKF